MMAGVDEADKLDADQAKHVLRRAAGMMRPYRSKLYLSIGLIALYTVCILAGPYLVRWAIDDGITAGRASVLNAAIVLYIVVAGVNYLAQRAAILMLARVGESFLRDLRLRVFATSSGSRCRTTTGRRPASSSAA